MNFICCALAMFSLFLLQTGHASSGVSDTCPLEPSKEGSAKAPMSALCAQYNDLNTRIRDGRIERRSARHELRSLLSQIRDRYYEMGGSSSFEQSRVFPLAGYDMRAIGGSRRHGFAPRGYDFFAGNRHGGHPAYDIFIRDRRSRDPDDLSHKQVKVVSMTGGIVVALEREWEDGSTLRGGRYVWVYEPASNLLIYYAHNNELLVNLGDVVKAGDVLATVGRTGFNAAKPRSPSHLHLSVLRVLDGRPVPLNVYRYLKAARTLPAG